MSAHTPHRDWCCASSPDIARTRHTCLSRDLNLPKTKIPCSLVETEPPLTLVQGSALGARERGLGRRAGRLRACDAMATRAGPHSQLAWRGRSRRAAICARRDMGPRGVTTSPGLRRPSLGDDVAAWLLLYGAASEAAIATATLPPPRLTPPRRAGEGAPGGGHYRDVTGRGAIAALALRRLGSDKAATGAARAGRRLGCAGTYDVGLEGATAGRARSRKVREVELVLLHRGRAMDFAVGLPPFQDSIAVAGAVGGRGGW